MEPADEMKFEVSTDVHGTADGPRLGRQRVINKVSRLHQFTYMISKTQFLHRILHCSKSRV